MNPGLFYMLHYSSNKYFVPEIECVPWHGSGDLRALSEANALAIFPAGDTPFEIGQAVAYLPLV